MGATKALVEFQNVFDGLTKPWVKEDDFGVEKKQPEFFNIKKVN